jgi:hypothetical protein
LAQPTTERAATATPATRILRRASEVMVVPGPQWRLVRRPRIGRYAQAVSSRWRSDAPTRAGYEYAVICEKGKHQVHDSVIKSRS